MTNMAMTWMKWLQEYGYMDGIDVADMDDAGIRIMAADYLDGCDEYDTEYDDDISADMIKWARM